METCKSRFEVYTSACPPKIDDVKRVFLSCDWGWPSSDVTAETALNNSWRTFLVFSEAVPVGFARLISDGIRYALLVDMMIAPAYRKLGLGGQLLDKILQITDAAAISSLSLLSSKEGKSVYQKAGFEVCPQDSPGMHRLKKLVS